MTSRIVPSDSYVHFLVPPIQQGAPDYIKNVLPEYRITHLLGSGGFADVYEGSDPNGWGVAIKVPQFKMDKTIDSSVLEKFALEADIWKKLDHENIINLYASNPRPVPHIVMELMEGGDLKGLMRNHRLTVEEAVYIMLQVLEGMSYAHRMASVHRDLKPENILFTKEGRAKITDWGIGKYMASEGITKTIETKGTLAYSAPEQFDTRKYGKVDWQTDIFQLGIVFYEVLTGVKPFEGQDMAEVMGKVLKYQPFPPSSLNPSVPSELDEIVMRALVKEKKERWESGAVMLHELKAVICGKKVKIPQSKKVEWDPGPQKVKSIKERGFNKIEGNICPLCSNVIDHDNRKLKCKKCKKFFCQMCEGWIDKIEEFRGYEIEIRHSLCEDCYKNAIIREKENVDNLIEREKEKALKLQKRTDERKEYCREKGFPFFKGFNQRYKEIKHLIKVESFQKAYEESLDLISDLEIHIEEKEEIKERLRESKKAITRIRCPKCGSPIVVPSEIRPLDIKCENCGARGRLRDTIPDIDDEYFGDKTEISKTISSQGKKKFSFLAIASFIISICGGIYLTREAFIGGIDIGTSLFVALVFGGISIIFGGIGVEQIKKDPLNYRGKGFGYLGIIFGFLNIFGYGVLYFFLNFIQQ